MRMTLRQGTADSWVVPIVDGDGAALVYSGAEPLSATVWPGGGQAALAVLAPTWEAPALGTTRIAVSAVTSALLTPATYRLVAAVTTADGPQDYYEGTLEILAAAGAVAAPKVYCTLDDLRDHAAWIDDLLADTDVAGFARQRGLARGWLDDILVGRFSSAANNGPVLAGDPGFAAWSMGGTGAAPPSKWLRDQLNADRLIVRDLTREIVAKRALHLICRPQLGKVGETDYQRLARAFAGECQDLVKTYRAEIDLSGDGYADVVINCGATSLR